MNTLYIDTHSSDIVLILFQDGKVLNKLENHDTIHQSSLIMPYIEKLLKEADLSVHDLTDIIVINGPGSFTGIRLGVTIAKAFSYTLSIPLRVMSSILIKAVSNREKGHHWFLETEKNGYFVGEFNDMDELLNDYFYIKKSEFANFALQHDIIEKQELDYEHIYEFSRTLPVVPAHRANPLYVKLIEVQK